MLDVDRSVYIKKIMIILPSKFYEDTNVTNIDRYEFYRDIFMESQSDYQSVSQLAHIPFILCIIALETSQYIGSTHRVYRQIYTICQFCWKRSLLWDGGSI